jgi:hypothetical protein
VACRTLYQNPELEFNFFLLDMASSMGRWVKILFHCPTIISVLPAMAAWTAFCPRSVQKTESAGFAGVLLII